MTGLSKGWATHAITALGLAAIVGGFLIAGGPGQGRAERRDDLRRSDLWSLQAQLDCLARERRVLSPMIESTAACPSTPRLSDPATGQAYVVEQIDDENLRLCASFEAAPEDPTRPRHAGQAGFDERGCMVMNLPRSQYQPGG
ncbi:hypothetical protein [uncultured Paracoccus sp.]|uniref:hypothetical protein n=1 Tax=uncultured Paracoccus sp. TaxID=189685 RepID=UPI00260FCDE9|nr:hypothetical protein [uncultured Paracoccus sp.]